jgi:cell division septation protein DedD
VPKPGRVVPPARSAPRFIQLVATPYKDRAEALVAQLRKQGFSAYMKSTERLHIVRLRPAGSEPLEDTLERVNRLGHAGQIFGE